MAVTPQPGDVVLAANEETGEVAYKEVVRTFVNTTDEITHVTILSTEHKGENMLKCKYTTFSNCGQLFILITRVQFIELKECKQLDGVALPNSLIDWLESMLTFTEHHSGFSCGITKLRIGKLRSFWNPILFFWSQNELVRVGIENVKCCCGWEGIIANPTLPYLFDAIPNRYEEMNKAVQYGKCICPLCNKQIDRNAIWIGNKE